MSARLVLFDIDGTLMTCGRQVGLLFLSVLKEVFGTYGEPRRCSFAGKTDSKIVFDLMATAGFDRQGVEDRIPEIRARYLSLLEERLDVREMRLFAGVRDLLEVLAARPEVAVGLLTGNWEGGARAKLKRFDLNRYFDFGAFGDDGVERHELPPVALERALERTGRDFSPESVWIVGDTLRDIDCARQNGLRVLAVATGASSTGELREAGADHVFENLENPLAREVLLGA